jgi:hypothetical protein
MDLAEFQPIAAAPLDGTPVLLTCETHPEFGAHVMGWSTKEKRWEGWAFAPMQKVRTCWDEAQPQPTHFRIVN